MKTLARAVVVAAVGLSAIDADAAPLTRTDFSVAATDVALDTLLGRTDVDNGDRLSIPHSASDIGLLNLKALDTGNTARGGEASSGTVRASALQERFIDLGERSVISEVTLTSHDASSETFSFTTDDTVMDGLFIPEPATLAVFATGLAALILLRRRAAKRR